MKRLLCLAAGTALASGLLGTSPLGGAAPVAAQSQAVNYQGVRGCPEISVGVLADARRADEAVPDPYIVDTRAGGKAQLGISMKDCNEVTVNGSRSKPTHISAAGIRLSSGHIYMLWKLTDNQELAGGLARLKVVGGMVRNMSVSRSALEMTANVPWEDSPYSLSIKRASVAALVPGPPLDGVWWHQGTGGLVRTDYHFDGADLAPPMAGTVSARPGSFLAWLMDTENAIGVGGFVELYDFTATMSIAVGGDQS